MCGTALSIKRLPWEGRRGWATSGAFLLGWSGAVWGCTAPIQGEFAQEFRLLAGLYERLRLRQTDYEHFLIASH
jgi:hypothetical protein